jgi:hypothetical protein
VTVKLGDQVEALRDACFTWNSTVQAGDRFWIREVDMPAVETLGDTFDHFFRVVPEYERSGEYLIQEEP